jgi:hypothetical protein
MLIVLEVGEKLQSWLQKFFFLMIIKERTFLYGLFTDLQVHDLEDRVLQDVLLLISCMTVTVLFIRCELYSDPADGADYTGTCAFVDGAHF